MNIGPESEHDRQANPGCSIVLIASQHPGHDHAIEDHTGKLRSDHQQLIEVDLKEDARRQNSAETVGAG